MIRSILVPLDGSTFGEHALPMAASLARRAGAILQLVHVHQIVPPTTLAGVAVMDSLDQHVRQEELAYLADVARRISERGAIRVETALIEGDVAHALHDFAEQVAADLVVMSTHGRGAVGRFWLGSVADDLIRELPRPVLLVRPYEGQPDLSREPQLKSIVLPLDGTPHAEKVLEPALDLGTLFGATFTLVRVIKPVLRPSYLPEGSTLHGLMHGVTAEVEQLQQHLRQMEAQHQAEAQRYLDEVAARLFERGQQVQTRVTIDEIPAVGILQEAQVRHADLIALETHARRGLSRVLRASVADKLIRGGSVPVLLSRPVE